MHRLTPSAVIIDQFSKNVWISMTGKLSLPTCMLVDEILKGVSFNPKTHSSCQDLKKEWFQQWSFKLQIKKEKPGAFFDQNSRFCRNSWRISMSAYFRRKSWKRQRSLLVPFTYFFFLLGDPGCFYSSFPVGFLQILEYFKKLTKFWSRKKKLKGFSRFSLISCFLLQSELFKIKEGQIKAKADWRAIDSPKKQTCVLFAVNSQKSKQNKFVRFFWG